MARQTDKPFGSMGCFEAGGGGGDEVSHSDSDSAENGGGDLERRERNGEVGVDVGVENRGVVWQT